MKLRLGNSCGQEEYTYSNLARYGYDCGDFQMANTDDEIYHVSDEEFVKRLETIKGYADKHGIHWRLDGKIYDHMARAQVLMAKQILHEPIE